MRSSFVFPSVVSATWQRTLPTLKKLVPAYFMAVSQTTGCPNCHAVGIIHRMGGDFIVTYHTRQHLQVCVAMAAHIQHIGTQMFTSSQQGVVLYWGRHNAAVSLMSTHLHLAHWFHLVQKSCTNLEWALYLERITPLTFLMGFALLIIGTATPSLLATIWRNWSQPL